ncbi:glyceraldehyde-3-phosphate dehydrogenase, type I, partial [mine drainage metagenome]
MARRGDEMAVRVGINGFGRIGRNYLRALLALDSLGNGSDIELVAVNDMVKKDVLAYLLEHDSTYGRLGHEVEETPSGIRVAARDVALLSEPDPKAIPWGDLGVEVVVESTGRFTTRSAAAAHLRSGVSRVIISAPSGDADATFVVGVNDADFDPAAHVVVSNASCTTNCLVPMVKVLDEAFGLRQGLMTTVHAYTNDQQL